MRTKVRTPPCGLKSALRIGTVNVGNHDPWRNRNGPKVKPGTVKIFDECTAKP
jgi:hypothetical protein